MSSNTSQAVDSSESNQSPLQFNPLLQHSFTWQELTNAKHKFVNSHKKMLLNRMELLWKNADDNLLINEKVTISKWAPPMIKNSFEFPFKSSTSKQYILADIMPFGFSTIDEDIKEEEPNITVDDYEWYHLNFADSILFGFYAGSLLAHDELQCLEMPFLAFTREAMLRDDNLKTQATTQDKHGGPTPVIVQNVPHLGTLDLKNGSLYGNKFRIASSDVVNDAFTVESSLKSAPKANIIAISSLRCKSGEYKESQIRYLLESCIAAFGGARATLNNSKKLAIHTGFLGCGAFGGHKVLMCLIQIVAATICNVDYLCINVVDKNGMSFATEAYKLYNNDFKSKETWNFSEIVKQLVSYGFKWGQSDGN